MSTLHELIEAATPGPWVSERHFGSSRIATEGLPRASGPGLPAVATEVWRVDDARFITTARTALPALVEALEALVVNCRYACMNGQPCEDHAPARALLEKDW